MNSVGDLGVERVVVMKAAQVGWTEIVNNAVGFYIDQDPAPLLVIQPTEAMADTWSKDRLSPMLRDTPVLRNKVAEAKSRDSGNTITQKTFDGGRVTVIGANAPSQLASRPIRVVLADEVDRYPASAGSEGDPLALAAKRQTTFWNRKTLIGSTPTLRGRSVVEREWEASDKRRYYVPCEHCGAFQFLKWAQVKWLRADDGGHRPDTALYHCEECGAGWSDRERIDAIAVGEWRATAPFTGTAGFHIPGFISPWLTLSEIVREFLAARHDPVLLQVWINTVLGETWEEQGERVSDSVLFNRREAFGPEELPEGVRVITAGVDIQQDRLEVQLIGWGGMEESWPFAYFMLPGDPALSDLWAELDAILTRSFMTEDGRTLRVRSACIDAGSIYASQAMTFARARAKRRVFATKGQAGAARPIWPKRASRAKGNQQVWVIGVDTAKDIVYGRLRIDRIGPGYVHFAATDDFDEKYFAQLTAETVVTRHKENRPYRVWTLKKGQRNEALDTFVYALAALRALPFRLDDHSPARPIAYPPSEPTPPPVQGMSDDTALPPPSSAPNALQRRQSRVRRRRMASNYMGR
jgi:phage terminase large subunit GpA-like protein